MIGDVCAICARALSRETCALPCGHIFCRNCISRACASARTCPRCGEPFATLQEQVAGKPTGFVFSAKRLAELYRTSAAPEPVAVPEPVKNPPPPRPRGVSRFEPMLLLQSHRA